MAASVASLTESVRQMQDALSNPVDGIGAMTGRIVALENHSQPQNPGPQGASASNGKMTMPARFDRPGVHQTDGQYLRATMTSQGGDDSSIHNGSR
ncbi:hypothetical protein HPB50_003278 [Hyalomma asiaticum]|uniref:Uncharacterized protein n=1 Tax=Hyalomma asiaticum TaxID=266040 RepID=A0ACB7S044_HYAAI|nr:hypothetical protein HPB50_003278 [Hyalomma asiaticum]